MISVYTSQMTTPAAAEVGRSYHQVQVTYQGRCVESICAETKLYNNFK